MKLVLLLWISSMTYFTTSSGPVHLRQAEREETPTLMMKRRELLAVHPSLLTAGCAGLAKFLTSAFLEALPAVYNFDTLGPTQGFHPPMIQYLDHILESRDNDDDPKDSRFFKKSTSRQGEGVNIYFIDSGVQVDHPDFEGRVTLLADFSSNEHRETTYDELGHGTAVAGVAMSKSYGIAPRARAFSVRVASKSGEDSNLMSNVALTAAYDAIFRHLMTQSPQQRQKSVINVSLGVPPSITKSLMLQRLVSTGAIVITSAGNEGLDVRFDRLSHPKTHPNVLTVGAMTNGLHKCTFSNFGASVDVLAPGLNVKTLSRDRRFTTKEESGTSLAAPFISGVVAVLLSDDDDDTTREGTLSMADIRAKLLDMSSCDIEYAGKTYPGIDHEDLEKFLRENNDASSKRL